MAKPVLAELLRFIAANEELPRALGNQRVVNVNRARGASNGPQTALYIEHVEKFICPTITSDQILGGKPFRFSGDLARD